MVADPLRALKKRIAEVYDPDVLVDMLEITAEELLDAFELQLTMNEELMHLQEEE